MSYGYDGGDPANYPQASVGFDYDAVDNLDGPMHSPVIDHSTADALIRLLDFTNSDNYRLRCDVVAAGSGLALFMGMSYTEMAKRHGISKQAFDKHVLKFQKDFRLPVTRAQKSVAARESYRKTHLDRQERLKQTHNNTREREELVWQNSQRKAPKEQ
jgi:hypothetical protein